jgi:hypothetical protein
MFAGTPVISNTERGDVGANALTSTVDAKFMPCEKEVAPGCHAVFCHLGDEKNGPGIFCRAGVSMAESQLSVRGAKARYLAHHGETARSRMSSRARTNPKKSTRRAASRFDLLRGNQRYKFRTGSGYQKGRRVHTGPPPLIFLETSVISET